jgi:hypothetical protein
MNLFMILGALLVVGVLYFLITQAANISTDGKVVLFGNSVSGETQQSSIVSIPRSYNEPEGLTYSYTGWILVKDFTKGFGTKRRIFSKNDSPGLYLDTTSNAFMVVIDTFGATETILISDIPAMKWIHFALVVDQHAVVVYINGILKKHHTLAQLPQQNDGAVTAGPGWSGVLARLDYYPRSLDHIEVKKLLKEPLPDDLEREVSGPNYFDISWYIGRLYSA